MTPAQKFTAQVDGFIAVMERAGFPDVARGLRLAAEVAQPIIEELQAEVPPPKKQRRSRNISPEERQRRADWFRAYHAKRRENRA